MKILALWICVAFITLLQAQTATSSPSDPVRIISLVEIVTGAAQGIEVELYNQSSKGIVAYALVLRGGDIQQILRDIKGPRPGEDVIPDSTRWIKRFGSAITSDNSEVVVDYVRFDNDEAWGPNESH